MQPVNLPLGVFSRAEQRVLQSIFKAIAEGGGRCVATLETLAHNSNTQQVNRAKRDRHAQSKLACSKRRNAAIAAQSRFPTF